MRKSIMAIQRAKSFIVPDASITTVQNALRRSIHGRGLLRRGIGHARYANPETPFKTVLLPNPCVVFTFPMLTYSIYVYAPLQLVNTL